MQPIPDLITLNHYCGASLSLAFIGRIVSFLGSITVLSIRGHILKYLEVLGLLALSFSNWVYTDNNHGLNVVASYTVILFLLFQLYEGNIFGNFLFSASFWALPVVVYYYSRSGPCDGSAYTYFAGGLLFLGYSVIVLASYLLLAIVTIVTRYIYFLLAPGYHILRGAQYIWASLDVCYEKIIPPFGPLEDVTRNKDYTAFTEINKITYPALWVGLKITNFFEYFTGLIGNTIALPDPRKYYSEGVQTPLFSFSGG